MNDIVAWALRNLTSFTANGAGRMYGILSNFADVPSCVFTIKQSLEKQYGVSNAEQEPMYKDFCGVNFAGAAVHRHIDANLYGKQHVRLNYLVSKPHGGGIPVIDDVPMEVAEGASWRCNAGKQYHWSTPVEGDKPRIVLSFGYLI